MTAVDTRERATGAVVPRQARGERTPALRPVSTRRLVAVELRKMLDTRSGFWLLTSIGLTGLLATIVVIVWAPESEQTYDTFAGAVGFPMAVILPMVAILSVTGEWSQRTALTTFTLVPHRGRVLRAKAAAALVVAVASMALAVVLGAAGHLVGTAISGADLVWDMTVEHWLLIVLGNVIGLMMGFALGVLFRSSPGAIVAYFVYSLVVPTLTGLLAMTQDWFADLQQWVDLGFTQGFLFNGDMTGERWAALATSGSLWLVLPLAVGTALTLRSEVK